MRYTTADEAVAHIHSGDYLYWPCVAAAPEHLIEALVRRADRGELRDIRISHFYTEGYADYVLPQYKGVFQLDSFFVGGNVRQATQSGLADYIPCSLSECPRFISRGTLGCDVVMLTVSQPDDRGRVSLGTSVDYMPEAIARARIVIAQVNRHMPFTYGDGVLQLKNSGDDADAAIVLEGREVPLLLVRHDQPLKEAGRAPLSETDIAIGRHAAALIPDGATLQIGIGNIPTAVLSQLGDHKDLGVHSEMFTDDVIPLVEKGVLNGRLKKTDPGKLVAMFLKGNQPLYDFVDHNEQVLMKDVGYTNSPMVIAQNPRVVALNSAIEIDLSGQVCSDSIGSKVFSGSGGQLDFILGATYSNGGVPIIAMPSLTGKGKSKIVPTLTPGAGVVTPRTLTQWVVTEHGAVNLYGKSLRERARLLISISDPSQREKLERAFNNM